MRRTRARGGPPIIWALVTLVAVTLFCVFSVTKRLPFQHRYEIRAAFRDAQLVKKGMAVRIAGVDAGKILGAEAGPDGTAIVRIAFKDGALPLHRDARIKLRPRLLFEGNYFLDVRPGTPRAGLLADGSVLPASQTSSAVSIGEVLGVFDQGTRDDLRVVLHELGTALKRSGPAVNATAKYLEPAYRDGAIVADAQIGERAGQLSEYLSAAGVVNRAFDADPAALKRLITDLRSTAAAFVDERGNLDATLVELPRLLKVGTPALRDLNSSFAPLRRLVVDLRRAVRTAPPSLDAQLVLARQLRGLVRPGELRGLARDLRTLAPSLARANRRAVPLAEQGRQLSSCQNEVLTPFSQDKVGDPAFPAEGKVFQEFPETLVGLAGESSSTDANGDWFRIYATTGTKSYNLGGGQVLQSAQPIEGVNPPPPARFSPLRNDVPCETQQTPDLRSKPAAAPPEAKLDTSSPRVLARSAEAQAVAVDWLRKQVKTEGMTGRLSVSPTALRRDQLAGPLGTLKP